MNQSDWSKAENIGIRRNARELIHLISKGCPVPDSQKQNPLWPNPNLTLSMLRWLVPVAAENLLQIALDTGQRTVGPDMVIQAFAGPLHVAGIQDRLGEGQARIQAACEVYLGGRIDLDLPENRSAFALIDLLAVANVEAIRQVNGRSRATLIWRKTRLSNCIIPKGIKLVAGQTVLMHYGVVICIWPAGFSDKTIAMVNRQGNDPKIKKLLADLPEGINCTTFCPGPETSGLDLTKAEERL